MVFQNVLVALDGSEHSERALETAIQIAKSLGSKLVLLTVHHDAIASVTSPEMTVHLPGTVPDGPSPELTEMANEAAHDYDKKFLAKAEARVRAEKVDVETEFAEGDLVEEIVKKSKEDGFDLIVMGARGSGRLKKLFIGSVSDGVIKNAPCPVLIIK